MKNLVKYFITIVIGNIAITSSNASSFDNPNQMKQNSNRVINNEYGFSFSIPSSLKFFVKNLNNFSVIESRATTNSNNDMIIIAPISMDYESFQNQLKANGFNYNSEGKVAEYISNTLNMGVVYYSSPYGGGVMLAYMYPNDDSRLIRMNELLAVGNSMKFHLPNMNFQQRIAFEQPQQQRTYQNNYSRPNSVTEYRYDQIGKGLDIVEMKMRAQFGY